MSATQVSLCAQEKIGGISNKQVRADTKNGRTLQSLLYYKYNMRDLVSNMNNPTGQGSDWSKQNNPRLQDLYVTYLQASSLQVEPAGRLHTPTTLLATVILVAPI